MRLAAGGFAHCAGGRPDGLGSNGEGPRPLPIDVGAMRDADDRHRDDCILDRVHDTVVTLPDPVLILAGELLGAVRSWIVRERKNAADDEATNPGGKVFDLLLCRPLDDDAIGGHGA